MLIFLPDKSVLSVYDLSPVPLALGSSASSHSQKAFASPPVPSSWYVALHPYQASAHIPRCFCKGQPACLLCFCSAQGSLSNAQLLPDMPWALDVFCDYRLQCLVIKR